MDDGMGGNLDLYRELAAEEPFNLAPESASSGYPNRFIKLWVAGGVADPDSTPFPQGALMHTL